MMRTLTCLTGALLITAGLLGCTPEVNDPFTSLTVGTNTVATLGDGDGDGDMETGTTSMGDGDGAPGDGDGTPGDGDGAPMCGAFGDACAMDTDCCDGFSCGGDGTCGIGGGDGDGAPEPCTSGYDPNMCAPPAQALGVQGVEGGFCSCPCTTDADCPAGPPGTMGACALTMNDPNVPEFCALLCPPVDPNDPNAVDACPDGSSCQEVQMGVGICTWPSP